jgi:hypothetical protein
LQVEARQLYSATFVLDLVARRMLETIKALKDLVVELGKLGPDGIVALKLIARLMLLIFLFFIATPFLLRL